MEKVPDSPFLARSDPSPLPAGGYPSKGGKSWKPGAQRRFAARVAKRRFAARAAQRRFAAAARAACRRFRPAARRMFRETPRGVFPS